MLPASDSDAGSIGYVAFSLLAAMYLPW